jgi:hypothetical protein
VTKKSDSYRETLRELADWEPFLLAESGLPGPRGNLELANVAADEGDEPFFRRMLAYDPQRAPTNDPHEFLAFCGVIGLGYCWSVAVAAFPEQGRPRMERWIDSTDRDVQWVMKQNLRKTRLTRRDPKWVERARHRLKL